MSIPIYSDVDIKGGVNINKDTVIQQNLQINHDATVQQNLQINNDAIVQQNLQVNGSAQICGDLYMTDKIEINSTAVVVTKPAIIADSQFMPEGTQSFQLNINTMLSIGEQGEYQIVASGTILVPPALFNAKWTLKRYIITDSYGTEIQASVFGSPHFYQDIGSTNKLRIRVTFAEMQSGSFDERNEPYDVTLVCEAKTDAFTSIPQLYTGTSSQTVDQRLNDLDTRLQELGFSGGYVITCDVAYESGLSYKRKNNCIIGYIARFGKIEYGYIMSGSAIGSKNGISNVAFLYPNSINYPKSSFYGTTISGYSVTWDSVGNLIQPYQHIVSFGRDANNQLSIAIGEATATSIGKTSWGYFCWSIDGQYEPDILQS